MPPHLYVYMLLVLCRMILVSPDVTSSFELLAPLSPVIYVLCSRVLVRLECLRLECAAYQGQWVHHRVEYLDR